VVREEENGEMAWVCLFARTYNTTVVLFVRGGAVGTRGACGGCRAACAGGIQRDDKSTATIRWVDRQVPMRNSLSVRRRQILQVEVGKLL
jgi:hypothetical protein